jgi:hypothetical protein
MFFRFASALALVVAISLAGTALEKRNLELKRMVSRQQYRLAVLLEQHAANRVLAHQLGAPHRLIDKIDDEPASSDVPSKSTKPTRTNARPTRHNAHRRPGESPRPAP